MSIASEFKEFAMKGNVVDMAVGVIIGAAFGKIVSSLVENVIMPPLGMALSGVNFSDLGSVIGQGPDGKDVLLKYGAFFQTIFDRKSRRVGLGMTVDSQVIPYESPYRAVPMSELEEALVVMAGTGLMGLSLADLDPVRGASTLVQWTSRSWPSSCNNHGTELFWSNDEGLWWLNIREMQPDPGEVATLSGKSVVAVALVYALYIGVTCPCKPELYSCHLSEMYLALAVVVAVMVFFNGSHLRSYNLHLR